MKKNLVFKIIALVSVLLMIAAIFISNDTVQLIFGLVGSTALFVLSILKWVVPAKKSVLFRIIALSSLYLLLLSWVIPASQANGAEVTSLGLSRMSLYNLVDYPYLAFQYFLQPLLFILAVGGFYGILESTGTYRTTLEKIAKSMKGKEKVFLVAVSIVFALLSSIFGINLVLFMFIPAIIAIVLLMGYDKLTAFLVSFIAPLVGVIGSTYGTYVTGYINQMVGSDFTTELVAKIGLFVLSFAIFAAFLLKHAESSKNKTELSEKAESMYLGEKKVSKKKAWPLVVVFALLFVLLGVGYADWSETFGVTFFSDMHTTLNEWTIGDHTVLNYFFNGTSGLGGLYFEAYTLLILVASILVSVIYNIKLDEALSNFGKGLVKVLKPAFLVVFAYILVIITAYHPYIVTITEAMVRLISNVSGVFGDILYIIMVSLNTILSSILNIDMLYVVQSSVPYLSAFYTESVESLAIITQSLYGLTLFVAPTSTMLLLGLTYLEIPYKEWLKKSWKLLVELLVVSLLIR